MSKANFSASRPGDSSGFNTTLQAFDDDKDGEIVADDHFDVLSAFSGKSHQSLNSSYSSEDVKPNDEGDVLYYIYLAYGISTRIVFMGILSTMNFYQMEMTDCDPAYTFNFGMNTLVVLMLVFSMLRGHHFSFALKNNLTIFLSIPFIILLPFAAMDISNETSKFFMCLFLLAILGLLNAASQGALYGHAGCFPDGSQMAAVSIGKGYAGILMNVL
jgi:hypothetical protein